MIEVRERRMSGKKSRQKAWETLLIKEKLSREDDD